LRRLRSDLAIIINRNQKSEAAPAKPAATSDKAAAEPMGAEVTTASFGGWQLSCRLTLVTAGQPSRRLCEVLHSVILQGQTTPFAQCHSA
jgi:hypothetical protein